MANAPLYVYIDEGGDFNFSPSGSKVYTITAIITHEPWGLLDEISKLRHQILSGEIHSDHLSQDYLDKYLCHRFHATEDKQVVRNSFFEIISRMDNIAAHSIVVKKNLANPALTEPNRFYSKITSSLMDYICKRYEFSKLCVFLDSVPVNKREAFLKAIKGEIKSKQPDVEFSIYFPPSHSNPYLQISDYINWAIFKKWESQDDRSYLLIEKVLKTKELDYFAKGDGTEYYQHKIKK